jgi:hypothetical protein
MLWRHPFGSRPGERESLGRGIPKERAVTKERSFKRRVRERMSKTGESYTSARSHVSEKRDRVQAARTRLATADKPASDSKVQEVTGRTLEAWFSILNRWGARESRNREMVRFLWRTGRRA